MVHIGVGYPIKIPDLYRLHLQRLKATNTGSQILVNTRVVKLLQEDPEVPGSPVIGAIVQRMSPDGSSGKYLEVRAKVVVLATGGFQGSKELRARFIGSGADNMFVRSNVGSVGDGLRLATAVGAATSAGLSTYYGHLMASPVRREDVTPEEFLPLAQYRKCTSLPRST
jgi:succinate dehydrogenase/fumarate reductase flavoprotein subunit